MEFFAILLALVLLTAAYPYLRLFVKRLSLWIRLNRFCRKNRCRLKGCRPFWIFARRSGSRPDFTVETSGELYSVKLFGMTRPRSALILTRDQYAVRRYYVLFGFSFPLRMPMDSPFRPLPAVDFYHPDSPEKNHRHVLLIHPVSQDIRRINESGTEEAAGIGQAICGMEIFTLSALLAEMEGSQ